MRRSITLAAALCAVAVPSAALAGVDTRAFACASMCEAVEAPEADATVPDSQDCPADYVCPQPHADEPATPAGVQRVCYTLDEHREIVVALSDCRASSSEFAEVQPVISAPTPGVTVRDVAAAGIGAGVVATFVVLLAILF